MRVRLLIAALVVAALVPAVRALATPQDDFNAVYADWKPDGDVTACRFTQQQLQNAYDIAQGSPDFQYSPAFSDEVQREIARWKAGGCPSVAPLSKRRRSPLYGARIVRVVGRGGAAREYVRVENRGRKTLAFRKATLSNERRGRATFPARFKLRAGKSALVHVGCARGGRHASSRGTRVWLCRRSQLFRDRGDIARLADAKGVVVSQRGFGSERRRVAY